MVTWTRTPVQWINFNIDGSALNNSGRIGAGGTLRCQIGKLLMTFTTPLGEGTNNKAKIEAANFGSNWALELGYKKKVLEVESLLVVNCIFEKQIPQRSITTQLE